MSASETTIRHALQRLIVQADALAYVSPERAHGLWERIRQIRHDLLSDPERRNTYDGRVRAQRVAGPFALAATTPSAPSPATRRSRSPIAAILAGVAVVAILALTAASALWKDSQTPGHHAVASSVAGLHADGVLLSGQPTTLQWAPVRRAARYRLTIYTLPPGAQVTTHRHLLRTLTTHATAYTLTVLGAQRYEWRVQAFVRGHWGKPSPIAGFDVARPVVGVPTAFNPADHASIAQSQARLCWTSVEGAVGYRLRIRGIGGRNLPGTCASVAVQPGHYRWTVAALVRGAQTYVGEYSSRQYFTVVSLLADRTTPTSTGGRSHQKHASVPAPVQHTPATTSAPPPMTAPSNAPRNAPPRLVAVAVAPTLGHRSAIHRERVTKTRRHSRARSHTVGRSHARRHARHHSRKRVAPGRAPRLVAAALPPARGQAALAHGLHLRGARARARARSSTWTAAPRIPLASPASPAPAIPPPPPPPPAPSAGVAEAGALPAAPPPRAVVQRPTSSPPYIYAPLAGSPTAPSTSSTTCTASPRAPAPSSGTIYLVPGASAAPADRGRHSC